MKPLALVGIASDVFDPGRLVSIRTTAQRPLRPIHFFVARSCAPSFDILAIRVGNNYQTLNPAPLPAECFASDLEEMAARLKEGDNSIPRIAFDAWMVGMEFSLDLKQIGFYPRAFRAMLACEVVDVDDPSIRRHW